MKDLKNKIISLTNKELDSIDMSEAYDILKPFPEREYLFGKSGTEHYRLLYWLSKNVSDYNIIEIGAFNGLSTACLSVNKKNEIFCYDLDFSTLHFESIPNNVTLMQVKNGDSEWFDKEGMKDADIIWVDSWHSGKMEKKIIEYLVEIKWKGVTIWDDIWFNYPMAKMWMSVNGDKHDLSEIGHIHGTGIIFFN